MSKSKCWTCLYHGYRTDTCDYMLITGRRRGVPVKDCNRYASNKQAKKLAAYFAGRGGLKPSDEEMLKLYNQGATDVEMAAIIGKSRILVAHWRRKLGLAAQRDIEVEARDD